MNRELLQQALDALKQTFQFQQTRDVIAALEAELAKPKQPNSIWVLTREINQYNQDGEYFVGAWRKKPTHQQLTEVGVPQDRLSMVLEGGGRVYPEEEWFYLKEQK
jgi:hypothetical protein